MYVCILCNPQQYFGKRRGDAQLSKRHAVLCAMTERWQQQKSVKRLGGGNREIFKESVYQELSKIWTRNNTSQRGKWCGKDNLEQFWLTPVGEMWSNTLHRTPAALVTFVNSHRLPDRFRTKEVEGDKVEAGKEYEEITVLAESQIGDLERDDVRGDEMDDVVVLEYDEGEEEPTETVHWACCTLCESWRILQQQWTKRHFWCALANTTCDEVCDSVGYDESQGSDAGACPSQRHSSQGSLQSPLTSPRPSGAKLASTPSCSQISQVSSASFGSPRKVSSSEYRDSANNGGGGGCGCGRKEKNGFRDDTDHEWYCWKCWKEDDILQHGKFDKRRLPFCTVTYDARGGPGSGQAFRQRGNSGLFYTMAEVTEYRNRNANGGGIAAVERRARIAELEAELEQLRSSNSVPGALAGDASAPPIDEAAPTAPACDSEELARKLQDDEDET